MSDIEATTPVRKMARVVTSHCCQ